MPCIQNINGDREAIYKFAWPLFCYEDWIEEDKNSKFLLYDYDTIEGIDHIISELDLENKSDENSLNFLYLLKARQNYFYHNSKKKKKNMLACFLI